MSQPAEPEDDDDSGEEPPLYIKEEDDDVRDDVNLDSTDANDTRLSELHNTTLKTEDESEEDIPLVYLNEYCSYASFVFGISSSVRLVNLTSFCFSFFFSYLNSDF